MEGLAVRDGIDTIASLYDRLRESAEQDIADRDPQEAVRIPKNVPETVAVSDTTTVTEHDAASIKLSTNPDGPTLEVGEL